MVEFPQPSADLLPSGLGEISLRRHQKLVSAENPDSVAITHPLVRARRLRNARGGAWRGAFALGEPRERGLGHPVGTLARKRSRWVLAFLCLLSEIRCFGVRVSLLVGPLFCLWHL